MSRPKAKRGGGRKTSNALEILRRRRRPDPQMELLLEQERVNAMISEWVYNARKKADLTQAELAKRVGTTQPVIARLENADYPGHSLKMLVRISMALGQRARIDLNPGKKQLQPVVP